MHKYGLNLQFLSFLKREKSNLTVDTCKDCGNQLIEAPLNLLMPEVPEHVKGKYCIPCQKAYWQGVLDVTDKRKGYFAKVINAPI